MRARGVAGQMLSLLVAAALVAVAAGCAMGVAVVEDENAAQPEAAPAAKTAKQISQYGITWTFDAEVQVGRFVTGDYYVVGPVTVVSVTPATAGSGADLRNGSMLNPPTTTAVAYDGRIRGFDDKLVARFPLKLKPGDSLVSSASLDQVQQNQVLENRTRRTETSPLRTAAVLTCLAQAAPPDAFRPSYCDLEKTTLRLARNVKWDKLPKVKPADGAPAWATVERMFERPWIDHVYGWHSRETHPSENMPGYGREIGRAVSMAALLLCSDYPRQQKEKLCLRLIQVGIDNWGVATRSKRGESGGWPAAGGFGNGRKLPIVFAAVMLDDPEMREIRKHAAEASFGEDEHVEFGKSWTGAKVRFTGQYPLIGDKQIDRGPYEHLKPGEWPGGNPTMSEGYRRCCTSVCWVGQALAMRLMNAQKVWDHDAFFVYVDRWMNEDDTKHLEQIKRSHPKFGGVKQGSTDFDPWIDRMWQAHRGPVDESTWKAE